MKQVFTVTKDGKFFTGTKEEIAQDWCRNFGIEIYVSEDDGEFLACNDVENFVIYSDDCATFSEFYESFFDDYIIGEADQIHEENGWYKAMKDKKLKKALKKFLKKKNFELKKIFEAHGYEIKEVI